MKRIFKLLIADKNKNVRDYLQRELSAEGYEILVAKTGVQIFSELECSQCPDLLILYLELPDTDTSMILEKAQERQPPMPVIIHTFLTEESARDNSGAAEIYIEKSGNIEHLKAAIGEMLRRHYPETLATA